MLDWLLTWRISGCSQLLVDVALHKMWWTFLVTNLASEIIQPIYWKSEWVDLGGAGRFKWGW